MSEPKRKHSTMRKGKRLATRKVEQKAMIVCKSCGALKIPHRICKQCGAR